MAGAGPSGQMRDENLHAVVARSAFASEKTKNTSGSDHAWKLRCRKSARRCGAKRISKSKCTKHTRFGPLLEVAIRTTFGSCDVEKVHAVVAKHIWNSKCTKHHMFAPLLEVQMCFRVAGARDGAPSQKVSKT